MLFRKQSFLDISDWIKEIKDNTEADVLIYLVGNMADKELDREVETEDAE